jgi:hypothetical protein
MENMEKLTMTGTPEIPTLPLVSTISILTNRDIGMNVETINGIGGIDGEIIEIKEKYVYLDDYSIVDDTTVTLAIEFTKNKHDYDVKNDQVLKAKQYLNETSWIWEKFNRNVIVLKDLTEEEFKIKYNDIILKQEEYRILINTIEPELINLENMLKNNTTVEINGGIK